MALVRNKENESKNHTVRFAVREMLTSSSFLLLNKTILGKYGLITGAILSNLVEKDKFWEQKRSDYNGWFFLTNDKQMELFSVSRGTIQRAKQTLIDENILRTKRVGVPAKEWFSIDYSKLMEQLINAPDPCNSQMPDFWYTSIPKSRTLVYQNPGDYSNNITNKNKNLAILGDPGKSEIMEKCEILSKHLSGIIRSKKKIKHTPAQITKWAKDIHSLLTKTLGDMSTEDAYQRIEKALHWYRSNIGQSFVPVIESGISLKEKFLRLESAIEREKEGSFSNPARRGLTGAKPIPNKYGKIKTLNEKLKERGEDDDDM